MYQTPQQSVSIDTASSSIECGLIICQLGANTITPMSTFPSIQIVLEMLGLVLYSEEL